MGHTGDGLIDIGKIGIVAIAMKWFWLISINGKKLLQHAIGHSETFNGETFLVTLVQLCTGLDIWRLTDEIQLFEETLVASLDKTRQFTQHDRNDS